MNPSIVRRLVGLGRQALVRAGLALALGSIAGPASAQPAATTWSIPPASEIAALVDARLAGREGVGMVVGVIEGGQRRVVARGPQGGPAFDGATLFEIGSITKIFTVLLLAEMAARDEVALDDRVARHLPGGTAMPANGGERITLRHLAMHASGLPRLPDNMPYGDPGNPYGDYGEPELLAFLGNHRLERRPGTGQTYSNLGFGLLGHALERAGGADYETLMKARVLGPLGMSATAITLSPAQTARLAPPHDAFLQLVRPWTFQALAGAGALRSNAEDLLTFLAAAGDPGSPIAGAMALALASRTRLDATSEAALGWFALATPAGEILLHSGGTGGTRAMIALDRARQRGVVVLTNAAAEPAAEDLALHLIAGAPMRQASPVPPPPPAPDRRAIVLPPQDLARFVGTYQIAPGLDLAIALRGEQLQAQVTGQPVFPITPSAPLTFFWQVVNAEITFDEDEQGVIVGGILRQNGQAIPVRSRAARPSPRRARQGEE